MSQKLFINNTGEVTTLRKKGGVDLVNLSGGKVAVKRISDIEWDEVDQCWKIYIMSTGKLGGIVTCGKAWGVAHGDMSYEKSEEAMGDSHDKHITFKEYEDAVAYEVWLINRARSVFGESFV